LSASIVVTDTIAADADTDSDVHTQRAVVADAHAHSDVHDDDGVELDEDGIYVGRGSRGVSVSANDDGLTPPVTAATIESVPTVTAPAAVAPTTVIAPPPPPPKRSSTSVREDVLALTAATTHAAAPSPVMIVEAPPSPLRANGHSVEPDFADPTDDPEYEPNFDSDDAMSLPG
jgi:hypothetical protein